uniref:Uncharacterized protein n=1 Tax=Trichogramma kaykai TaxID=54128 RepID=A0ABD2WZV5_9HYME
MVFVVRKLVDFIDTIKKTNDNRTNAKKYLSYGVGEPEEKVLGSKNPRLACITLFIHKGRHRRASLLESEKIVLFYYTAASYKRSIYEISSYQDPRK